MRRGNHVCISFLSSRFGQSVSVVVGLLRWLSGCFGGRLVVSVVVGLFRWSSGRSRNNQRKHRGVSFRLEPRSHRNRSARHRPAPRPRTSHLPSLLARSFQSLTRPPSEASSDEPHFATLSETSHEECAQFCAHSRAPDRKVRKSGTSQIRQSSKIERREVSRESAKLISSRCFPRRSRRPSRRRACA